MIHFTNIKEYQGTPEALSRQKWNRTEYVVVQTESELMQSAFLVTIDKTICSTSNEAFVALLLRYMGESEGWKPEDCNTIEPENFVAMALTHFISHEEGWPVENETCWKEINLVMENMKTSKGYEITKNGEPSGEEDLLKASDLCHVRCFSEKWNNLEYFIETPVSWAFFSWGTSA